MQIYSNQSDQVLSELFIYYKYPFIWLSLYIFQASSYQVKSKNIWSAISSIWWQSPVTRFKHLNRLETIIKSIDAAYQRDKFKFGIPQTQKGTIRAPVIGYAALNRDRDPMAWYVRDLFADKMIEAHFTLLFMDWDVGPSFLENISGYIWKGIASIFLRGV